MRDPRERPGPSNLGQDELLPTGVAPDGTPPITIKGGDNNPNPTLQGVTSISRSDSIITVPIYHRAGAPPDDLCPAGCTLTGTIVGFLQLGIQENTLGPNGQVKGVIMNVAGCNPGRRQPCGLRWRSVSYSCAAYSPVKRLQACFPLHERGRSRLHVRRHSRFCYWGGGLSGAGGTSDRAAPPSCIGACISCCMGCSGVSGSGVVASVTGGSGVAMAGCDMPPALR